MGARRLVPVIPDGGWGWVVVVGSFLVHVFADGFVYSFGILTDDILTAFECTNAEAAFIISLLTGLTLGCGPIASAITNKYGCRTSTLVGSAIATTGCLVTFWAHSLPYMIVTVGGIMGVGIGLMYCPAIVIVTMYFERWRALATGIAVSGAGIGTFVFPFIYGAVRERFGWKYVFLAGAAFMAGCGVCGLTFRPLQFVEKDEDEEEGSPVKSECSKESEPTTKENAALLAPPEHKLRATSHDAIHSTGSSGGLKAARSTGDVDAENGDGHRKRAGTVTESTGYLTVKDVYYTGSITDVDEFQQNPDKFRSMTSLGSGKRNKLDDVREEGDDDVFEEEEKGGKLSGVRNFLSGLLDVSLLTEPAFMLFAISNLLTSVGFNSPLFFLPVHCANVGLNTTQGEHVMSAFGALNTLGRVTFGLIGDRRLPLPYGLGNDTARNRLWIYNISLASCGVITMLSFIFVDYLGLIGFASAFGFSISSYICLTSVILVDLLGLEKLTNAFGLLLLFQGVGTVMGPPVAGLLADMGGTGVKEGKHNGSNYHWSFIFCGVNLLISGLMMFVAPWLRQASSCPKSQEKEKSTSNGETKKAIPLH